MPPFTSREDLLRQRLERFTRKLREIESGNPQAIHRTRVASRRLREVLPVLQLEPDVAAKLGRRLRKITSRLGSVREFDVLLAVIDELRGIGRYPHGALMRVAASISDDRGSARERLLAKVPLRELHRVAAKLTKVARKLNEADARSRSVAARRSWRWAIDARIARRAGALSAAMSKAGALYLSERLHAVRIAVKKLRYALELSVDVSRGRSNPDLRQLRRTQDILGRLHDLEVLIGRAREVQASLMPPDITSWRELDALIAALEDDCRRLHGRYMADRDVLFALCGRLSGQRADAKHLKTGIKR